MRGKPVLTDFQRLNGFGVMWGEFGLLAVASALARTAPFGDGSTPYVTASDMEGQARILIAEAVQAGRVEVVADGVWNGTKRTNP